MKQLEFNFNEKLYVYYFYDGENHWIVASSRDDALSIWKQFSINGKWEIFGKVPDNQALCVDGVYKKAEEWAEEIGSGILCSSIY